MRIAIDARALQWTGIGRYTRTLLGALATQKTKDEYVVLIAPKDVKAFNHLKTTALDERFTPHVVDGSYYSWREQTIFWRQLQTIDADLFHFTHFNVPWAFRRPYVVTIHDITRFIFPGQRRQDVWQQVSYEFIFKRAVEQARGIICVSQTTADDLRSLPLHLRGEVVVIHESIDPVFLTRAPMAPRQKVRMLIGTDEPYVLFVGVWMSHKNILRLLAAYAAVLKNYPHLKLVLTGRPKPGYSDIVRLTRHYGIERQVIFAGFVPHELLPALYAEATCFVLPSLYEGFGLPLLEAAASGIPIVAANVASIPEIIGDGAVYCNPEDEASITRAIQAVLTDSVLRQRIIAAATKRIALFQEQQMVAQHQKVYEQVMHK